MHTAESDQQSPGFADVLGFQIAPQEGIEKLIVAQLVCRDAPANVLQQRLLRRIADRAVETGGAHLDDAAGDQLAAPRTAHRLRSVQGQAEAVEKACEGAIEIEVGIRELCPAPQSLAVLHLFPRPALGLRAEGAVFREDVAQIGGVVAAIVLDQAGGLDDLDGVRIDLARIEAVPWHIVQRPVLG